MKIEEVIILIDISNIFQVFNRVTQSQSQNILLFEDFLIYDFDNKINDISIFNKEKKEKDK